MIAHPDPRTIKPKSEYIDGEMVGKAEMPLPKLSKTY